MEEERERVGREEGGETFYAKNEEFFLAPN